MSKLVIKQEIDYNTLTEEQLEEHVEFINWSLVPPHLLTKNIRQIFKSVPQMNAKIWFEDLMSKMEIREDQERFPNIVFYFVADEWNMLFSSKNTSLWGSSKFIGQIFIERFNFEKDEARLFFKNEVEHFFKIKKATPIFQELNGINIEHIKNHFNIK